MRVFIGMETSGELRRRFEAQGHCVLSCDILPAEDGCGYDPVEMTGHYVGDVFDTLEKLRWARLWPDLAIFHPTCTYLTISAAWAFNDPDYGRYPGVGYHQRVKPDTLTGGGRRDARERELDNIRRIMALPIKRKVLENPIGAISKAIRKPSQIVQPYQFGDDASKATCLWFIGKDGEELPDMALPIDPSKRVPGRMVEWPRGSGSMVERWSNQTDSGQNRLTPGEARWKDRSRTFPGIAGAGAAHWSALPPPPGVLT